MNEQPRFNIKWPFNPRAIRRRPSSYFKWRVWGDLAAVGVGVACFLVVYATTSILADVFTALGGN